MNPVTKQFQFGQSTVTLETGRIARQATGAVLVTMDDVSVLVTVVGAKSPGAGRAVFPRWVGIQGNNKPPGRVTGGVLERCGR
ncbi:polyribonucleotide nucleotidyltransferase, partial [Pseudomonas aeruginosa]|nr:polyribonucleotide nucleotidyltransferase [Pseudomonas aeruginosa]